MYQIMFQHTKPLNKNSLDKVYHEKKKKKNMGSIIDHISGTIYH